MDINCDRLKSDMDALNALGRIDGKPGINRVSFSDEDMAGRRLFMERCEAAGLSTRMDAVGNVIARWEVGDGPVVLSGSHLDTVPEGGEFDGTLGCCAALEAVRTLKDRQFQPGSPIEVVAFAEEEGRFGGMLGSQAMAGIVDPEWYAQAADEAGLHLHEAMRRQGFDPEQLAVAKRSADAVKAFLELHIEQGPVLEDENLDIGIATGISGIFNWSIKFNGIANHSGTTPMDRRRDAFAALATFAVRIPQIIKEAGALQTRITIGEVMLEPNFPHTVPGHATFSIVGRDPDRGVLERVADRCRQEIADAADAHQVSHGLHENSRIDPTHLDETLIEALDKAARKRDYSVKIMPCGAGHDVQSMSAIAPSGLILVPSRDGISHAPDEFTSWEACAKGTDVLMEAIRRLAGP